MIANNWLRQDRDGALKWIAGAPFAEDQKKRLLATPAR
jgi:hypothetical protein